MDKKGNDIGQGELPQQTKFYSKIYYIVLSMEATMLVPPLRSNKTKYNKNCVKFSLLNG